MESCVLEKRWLGLATVGNFRHLHGEPMSMSAIRSLSMASGVYELQSACGIFFKPDVLRMLK